jgi:hypothetical protein
MFYRQGWTQGELCFQMMFLVFFQHLILPHFLKVFIQKAVCRLMLLWHDGWKPASPDSWVVLLDCYYQAMTHEGIEGLVFTVVACRVCSFRESVIIIRFEVFTAVTVKNALFWDVAPCKYCVKRHFWGTYCFHLQGGKIHELSLQPPTHSGSSLRDFSTLKM